MKYLSWAPINRWIHCFEQFNIGKKTIQLYAYSRVEQDPVLAQGAKSP